MFYNGFDLPKSHRRVPPENQHPYCYVSTSFLVYVFGSLVRSYSLNSQHTKTEYLPTRLNKTFFSKVSKFLSCTNLSILGSQVPPDMVASNLFSNFASQIQSNC